MSDTNHSIHEDISQKVYVVGPDTSARSNLHTFLLEKCGLEPIKKEIAATWTEGGAPFSERVLDTIFKHAQVVIFLLTGEDEVSLRRDFVQSNDGRTKEERWLQPTQDQIFEAGYAFGRYHERVFLVRSGPVRRLSDIAGRYTYDFDDPEHQNALRNALKHLLHPVAIRPHNVEKKERHLQLDGVEPIKSYEDIYNRKRVFVVFGRNTFIAYEIRAFLQVIHLSPVTWGQALEGTGKAAAPSGEILEAAFNQAQAVVVLLTGDDLAQSKSQNSEEHNLDDEIPSVSQPRANVLFEAGMAFGDKRLKNNTILIDFDFDELKLGSNISDHHRLRLNNSTNRREEFIRRLHTAGCDVRLTDKKWHSTGDFYFSYEP